MNIFEEKKIKVADAVLALDLDGTLTNSKKQVTENTKAAIAGFIEAGGTVAKHFGVNLMTYNHDKAYALDIDEQYYMLEITINHFIRVKANPLTPQITFPIIKCLMTADGNYLAKVEKEMKKYWEGKLNIVRSEPYFLEVTEVGINKASTLTGMVKKLGKSVDNLICCGDGFNDLSMIKAAGIGVAMANAQEKVREAADYITKSNDEDGIVDVIEKLFEWEK